MQPERESNCFVICAYDDTQPNVCVCLLINIFAWQGVSRAWLLITFQSQF